MNLLLTSSTPQLSIDKVLLPFKIYNSNDGFGRVADQLNFAAPSEDEAEYPPGAYLKKGKQDPMSHRIIEKRRRDRMNNCLADLSRLIPPEYLKKGRGRVEKTEIIEMAIRHLKYLQERANAGERQVGAEHFRAGYHEATAEAVRFLVEVQGYGPGDGLCVQMASHLQRHCEGVTKGELPAREKPRSHPGSSSETASSSSSSHGYAVKHGVIAQAPPPAPPTYPPDPYDSERQHEQFPMECDRAVKSPFFPPVAPAPAADGEAMTEDEPLPLDGRRKREPTLRTVRKPEHSEDYLHSYKFKNSIERRFSRSQDNEAAENGTRPTPHGKVYNKRRRAAKLTPSTSTSGSTEETRDTSPQDTSSESPHHHNSYEKPPPPTQYVPVFALNSLGKYYVPLSVDYACLSRHLGPYDVLDARAVHLAAPLHPVTIHVNFQPCLNYHVKREPNDRDWRAV
ncbi:transcription factor cwo isoform X2 [Amyelois transitella]|uniref:transcription factor cwo isoform X2 n=1 Tax=Amyelois transitella TaxID=680683 RepID=UPI00299015EE|nr:transcription factor cwo isoform X2 [Amyelois transitella]